jgi:hypothetical protein
VIITFELEALLKKIKQWEKELQVLTGDSAFAF